MSKSIITLILLLFNTGHPAECFAICHEDWAPSGNIGIETIKFEKELSELIENNTGRICNSLEVSQRQNSPGVIISRLSIDD